MYKPPYTITTKMIKQIIEFMLEILQESLKDYINQSDKLGDKFNNLSKNRKSILKQIQNNPYVTIQELSKLVGISTTAIENNIKYLKQKEILKRVGQTKDGNWEIIS